MDKKGKLPKWVYPGLRIKRWVLLITFGVTLIGLGISYFLVEIYTKVQLPEVFYYLTLQFIDQIIRGVIFLIIGVLLIIFGLNNLFNSVVAALVPSREGDNLFSLVYEKRGPSKKTNVVAFANGMGLFLLLSAIKDLVSKIDVVLPMGEDATTYTELLKLNQLALPKVYIPNLPNSNICAEYDDGFIEKGLLSIKEARRLGHWIKRLFLEYENLDSFNAPVLDKDCVAAIQDADILLFGPSSLHVGIASTLLADEVSSAIQKSSGVKIFICNIMTEPGKTEKYSVSDHAQFLEELGKFDFDYIIINNKRVNYDLWKKYSDYGAAQVLIDLDEFEDTFLEISISNSGEELKTLNKARIIEADLIDAVSHYDDVDSINSFQKLVVRHNPDKLRNSINGIIQKLI